MSMLLVLLGIASMVSAQQAVCTRSDAQWVRNSMGQNPCTVAGYLGSLCTSTGRLVGIPPLSSGNHYLGPNVLNADNACRCSTVFYSLLAACSICQSRNYLGWSEYKENCTTVYPGLGSFPTELPAGTSVPAYAYQDVVRSDSFDPTRAQQSPTPPESSGTAHPTGTATAGGDSGAGAGAGSNGGSGTSGKGKGKVRKALGGVTIGIIVACFVVVTFICTVVGWYIRRRRRNQACNAPPPQQSKVDYGPVPISTPYYPTQANYSYSPYIPPPTGNAHYGQSDPTNYSPVHSPGPNRSYYDPTNPNTYNTMAGPPTHMGYTDYHPQPGYTYYPPNQGRYSVVPQAG
ncbi:hypothetical protein BDZ94DRAFT_1371479 [Collybia nuda]|uniref:Transmembrane protein n=1 Tax=Collybia nuda TaxID=64659 RepID=A0A9P5Y359_9AGAR|nr:hypothetical protein BDZ94DRAFT_1371479 [Collybia nuda]